MNPLRLIGALGALVWALFFGVLSCPGEEIILKNGQKLVGKIVAYENDMFRVETEYGFALVRKDEVESVNFPMDKKVEGAKKKGERKNASPGTSTEKSPPSAPVQNLANAQPSPQPVKRAAPPPPSKPLDEPLPGDVREHVEGTNYINDSFHFVMFKPPGWKVFENVPRETGTAIVALGTEDEQTLLYVDRQVWSGTPDLKSDFAEEKIRKTYPEYQKFLESHVDVDGHPAIRREFRGVLDGVEWHGLSVQFVQGNTIFVIVGLTSAETYEFHQAILNKIVSTFRFLAPAVTAASVPRAGSNR